MSLFFLLPSLFCSLFILSCLCRFLLLSLSFFPFHHFFIYVMYFCSFSSSFIHFLFLCLSHFFFLYSSLFLAKNYSRLQSLNEEQYQALEVPSRGGCSVIHKIYPSTSTSWNSSEWRNCTSTPSYVFMSWHLMNEWINWLIIKHKDDFTFTYCRTEYCNAKDIRRLPEDFWDWDYFCVFRMVPTINSDCFPKQH
jgi:hypothetical protein